jgi:hypothetical protein
MAWPTTPVATGDLVTAAQLNQLPIALAEASGAGASYDFTSIPAYWTHLLILCSLQTASGANSDTLKVNFNGDIAGNYLRQRDRFSNATIDALGSVSAGSLDMGECPGIATGSFGAYAIWIPNYAAAVKKSVLCIGHMASAIAVGSQYVTINGGIWHSASAINRVTIAAAAGSFVAGSIATLYGMGSI